MPKMILPVEDAKSAVYGDTDEFESIRTEVIDEWRWGNVYEAIIKEKSTGKYWSTSYRIQSGDNYYNSMDDEEQIEFYQVEPKEVTTVTYVDVKD